MAGASTTAMPYMAKAMPALRGRERVGQDGLLARPEPAAADALEDAEEDQPRRARARARREAS